MIKDDQAVLFNFRADFCTFTALVEPPVISCLEVNGSLNVLRSIPAVHCLT